MSTLDEKRQAKRKELSDFVHEIGETLLTGEFHPLFLRIARPQVEDGRTTGEIVFLISSADQARTMEILSEGGGDENLAK